MLIFFILLVHRRISPVNDYVGVKRTFKITINQTVDVSWQINGTEVQTNASVYDVSPPLANAIRDNGGLRTAVRAGFVKHVVHITRRVVG